MITVSILQSIGITFFCLQQNNKPKTRWNKIEKSFEKVGKGQTKYEIVAIQCEDDLTIELKDFDIQYACDKYNVYTV